MVIICKDGLLISNKLVVRPLMTSFILRDNDPSIPLLLFDWNFDFPSDCTQKDARTFNNVKFVFNSKIRNTGHERFVKDMTYEWIFQMISKTHQPFIGFIKIICFKINF